MHKDSQHKDAQSDEKVIVIGAGLAGAEAAFQLAQRGIQVELCEMRDKNSPESLTPAHKTELCAELVCSNSFRSSLPEASAVGILQREMKECNSIIMQCAEKNKLPAGSALAVDRVRFAQDVTKKIQSHPLIEFKRKRIDQLPEKRNAIIATGPLTDQKLAIEIQKNSNEKALAFFDAIAPLVYYESLDTSYLWMQSRYDRSTDEKSLGDYLNVPLDKNQYEQFVARLKSAETHPLREWEKNTPYFEGCLPIEVMAERGIETLRFGPMKPVGLTNPHEKNPIEANPIRENPLKESSQTEDDKAKDDKTRQTTQSKAKEKKLWAVVQLRRDDREGRLWNVVGFQTKMIYSAQAEILKSLPGFANAEFARLGGLHRNTFINAPQILDQFLNLKKMPNVKMAGQIVGVEGYLESAAIGMLAAIFTAQKLKQKIPTLPPQECALGALLAHVSGQKGAAETEKKQNYQPMNINFGLFPNIHKISTNNKNNNKATLKVKGREKKILLAQRAEKSFQCWWSQYKVTKTSEQE